MDFAISAREHFETDINILENKRHKQIKKAYKGN